jgi:anti-sigma B factor antagonist
VVPVSSARLSGSVHVVRLSGDFDLANVPRVTCSLDAAVADPETAVVAVDMSGVTFLGSTLLQALVSARDAAQVASKPVWLVRPPAVMWRVFEVTLLSRLFRDFESLAELEEHARATAHRLSPRAASSDSIPAAAE